MKESVLLHQRKELRAVLETSPQRYLPVSKEEVDAHFEHMPLRYWGNVKLDDLLWHLKDLHDFFNHLTKTRSGGVSPVVRWKHHPKKRFSEVRIS